MKTPSPGTIEVRVARNIAAAPDDVFAAWLDPEVPGTTWNAAEKVILDPRVDGLFFWRMRGTGTPHYGRFTIMQRPALIAHTWVSPNTLGQETVVTVTFEQTDGGTLMTLVHADLPDTEAGARHEAGWNFFLGTFQESAGKRRDFA